MFGMTNPQMQFSQQTTQPIRPPQFMGQWLSAANYQEMLTLPIPLNGAPVLVSLTDEPTVYILQMQGGQKVLSGFSITPLPGVNNNKPQPEKSDIDERLGKIEEALASLTKKKEAVTNEKSIVAVP